MEPIPKSEPPKGRKGAKNDPKFHKKDFLVGFYILKHWIQYILENGISYFSNLAPLNCANNQF